MFSDRLLDSQYVGYVALSQVIETVASRLGVVPIVARIHDSAEIKDAIQRFAQEPNGGLVVLPSPVTAVERELIVGLAAKHRLPAVYPYRFFTVSGGLVAYGVDPPRFLPQSGILCRSHPERRKALGSTGSIPDQI